MNDHDATFDDTELSAYLAGDLDDVSARRIEQALAEDGQLGRRLDRLHEALLTLRGPDLVEPPAGLDDRLRERLDAEPLPVRRRSWLPAVGAAAAAVVALALVGAGVLGGFGGGDDSESTIAFDESGEDAGAQSDDGAQDDAAEPSRELSTADSDDDAGDEAADSAETEESDGTVEARQEELERLADEHWEAVGDGVAGCRAAVEEVTGAPALPLGTNERLDDGRTVVVMELTLPLAGESDDLATVTVDPSTCDVLEADLP